MYLLGLLIRLCIFASLKISRENTFKGQSFLRNNSKMANHKSSKKRIRSNEAKKDRNRYQAKTLRNAIKTFRSVTVKKDADEALPKLTSMLDRLAKKNVIHKNKASNLKSELAVHIDHLK